MLIFEERRGPLSGEEEDADRTRRWAVRLTSVQTFDAGGDPLTDPVTTDQITNIKWMAEDALPFPFCLSGFTDEEHGAQYHDDLSIAHGNIVLADHGLTIDGESLGDSAVAADPTAARSRRGSMSSAARHNSPGRAFARRSRTNR